MTSRHASFRLTVLAGALALPAALAFGGCTHSMIEGDATGAGGTLGTGGDALGTGGVVAGTGGDVAGVGGTVAGSGGATNYTTSLGAGVQAIGATTTDRYAAANVTRDGLPFIFLANGWGNGWQSHNISYLGTSFTVASLAGVPGANFQPAGYPTVFCGVYADAAVRGCGLPIAFADAQTIKTGWRWSGGAGTYNAAYDIWLSNGINKSDHVAFLMVWLRDPPGQQPAGGKVASGVTVPGAPSTWDVWTGSVDSKPIVNYVRPEGQDLPEIEFDVMSFYNHAKGAGYNLPGTHVLSVAVGFEIWDNVSNLVSSDFYVDVN